MLGFASKRLFGGDTNHQLLRDVTSRPIVYISGAQKQKVQLNPSEQKERKKSHESFFMIKTLKK
jgi:hypothetical protein